MRPPLELVRAPDARTLAVTAAIAPLVQGAGIFRATAPEGWIAVEAVDADRNEIISYRVREEFDGADLRAAVERVFAEWRRRRLQSLLSGAPVRVEPDDR